MNNSEDEYFIRWVNHKNYCIDIISDLYNKKELYDITIFVEGKKIQAHKLILSACSLFFRRLIHNNPSPNLVIVLIDISYEDANILIDFFYSGKIRTFYANIKKFLKLFDRFEIQGINYKTVETNLSISPPMPNLFISTSASISPMPNMSSEPIPNMTSSISLMPNMSSAPIPNMSSAPMPNLSSAPMPNMSSEPMPNMSSEPMPNISSAPMPNITSSISLMPNTSSAPIPNMTSSISPMPNISSLMPNMYSTPIPNTTSSILPMPNISSLISLMPNMTSSISPMPNISSTISPMPNISSTPMPNTTSSISLTPNNSSALLTNILSTSTSNISFAPIENEYYNLLYNYENLIQSKNFPENQSKKKFDDYNSFEKLNYESSTQILNKELNIEQSTTNNIRCTRSSSKSDIKKPFTFDNWQINLLEMFFSRCKILNKEKLIILKSLTKLNENYIKLWYKNRRKEINKN